VARAIWAVAQSDLCGLINVGSGQPVTVRDIVTQIGILLDRSELIALGALPYGASDPMFICANNSRLIKNTAWVPRYGLEQGLQHTIAWWQRHLGVC
jgi:nucleoside-diphosphate-sugar epimerase